MAIALRADVKGSVASSFFLSWKRALSLMGKDRRKDKEEVDASLGKKQDKFGKKGDGKQAPTQGPDKSFSHQECRHILSEKQSVALRISEEIHEGKITFNEAAYKYSEDKAGAYGLLGWKSQSELDQDFCARRRLRKATSHAMCIERCLVPCPRYTSSCYS